MNRAECVIEKRKPYITSRPAALFSRQQNIYRDIIISANISTN